MSVTAGDREASVPPMPTLLLTHHTPSPATHARFDTVRHGDASGARTHFFDHVDACRELGATVAAGLVMGL